jgi:adenosylcobinamide-GDP ribazoletransferase
MALGYLTVLPLPGEPAPMDVRALPWLPAAGLVVGLLWAGFDLLVGRLFPLPVRAGLDLAILVAITGGLHLDGLADTADGLFAHRGRHRALEIMRDARMGVWGGIALVFVLLLDWAALMALLEAGSVWALVLVPGWARLAMLFAMKELPYCRESGAATGLFGHRARSRLWALLLAAASVLLLGLWHGLATAGAFALVTTAILIAYRRALGCLTGDMLGALGEVVQTALLIVLTLSL